MHARRTSAAACTRARGRPARRQVLSATCAVEEGSEALIPYASQGNAAFLTMYGFVPEHNPAAAMELFSGVAEAAAWAVAACPPPVRAILDGGRSRQAL